MSHPTVIVIVGPTSSGKSDLAVQVAKQIDGEVISADSRQVYKGMNIGSGKISQKEMRGIPHHVLDVATPKRTFTVSQYQKLAHQAIKNILKKGKTPIITGGTGLYIQAIVDNVVFPAVPPNSKLRQSLEKLPTSELSKKLLALDANRAKSIDVKNPRRLIRAIEIATALGKVPTISTSSLPYRFVIIGIKPDDEILKNNIHKRLIKRLHQGMIAEVQKLHDEGLSWKRLESFGLEYRFVAQYLQKKLTKLQMIELIEKEHWQYVKRQMTWFKRDTRITWIQEPQAALDILQTKSRPRNQSD